MNEVRRIDILLLQLDVEIPEADITRTKKRMEVLEARHTCDDSPQGRAEYFRIDAAHRAAESAFSALVHRQIALSNQRARLIDEARIASIRRDEADRARQVLADFERTGRLPTETREVRRTVRRDDGDAS